MIMEDSGSHVMFCRVQEVVITLLFFVQSASNLENVGLIRVTPQTDPHRLISLHA